MRTYLDITVMPLVLVKLQALRYQAPHGESQTVTTNKVLQLYREANINTMSGEEIGHLMAIHSVTNKEIIEDINKELSTLRTGEEVLRRVTMLDKSRISRGE